jgi:ligand-binding sensor domain-containing protein/AraC-like DNA-binding protein
MKRYKQIITTVIFALFIRSGYGQRVDYRTFENITISTESSGVNCFAQDSSGLLWMGSHRGLYSYNGFSTQAHSSEETNTRIYCLLVLDENRLCFGTDHGVFFYNYKSDRYEKSPALFPADVRTMLLRDSMLWIGSLNGLFRYNIRSGKIENSTELKNTKIPHQTIYSMINHEDDLYIGTYNGICRYRSDTDTFEPIELPRDSGRSNQFINCLLEDTLRQCIWIGMEGALFKYFPVTGRTESLHFFRNNSVKSIAPDRDQNLLIGTDNGLYIYHEREDSMQHIVHDSRNDKSLSNNIIWSIFADREQNIWLGTDYTVSLVRPNRTFRSIPISQITGVGDGNRFHALFRDSRGNFWMGGTNGLIFAPSLDQPASSIWYRMGDDRFPISHNRIRHIYEDKTGNLWIASDGSISRYNYREKQFTRYALIDSTRTYNSNWAYYLFEDDTNRLWIATCLGGIFVVNKQKLMQSQGHYVAEKNFNAQNGLPGSFVNQIIPDKNGNVWGLFYNNGMVEIDGENKINKIPIDHETGNNHPNYLLSDNEGFMWIGFNDGLVRINPDSKETKFIRLNTFEDSEILSITEEGRRLWITTTEGVWALDKPSLKLRRLGITNQLFSAGFYDPSTQTIYLGASDLLVSFSPTLLNEPETDFPIMLTALYVNGEPYRSGNLSIRYMHEAKLNHKQNNLAFEFSNLQYASEQENKFVYRLEGFDKQWKISKPPQTNRISYSNLKSGKYRLCISKLNSSGNPGENPFVFSFTILPPWYYTLAAKCTYILLCIAFILWIVLFFKMRNKSVLSLFPLEKPANSKPAEPNNPLTDKLLCEITQIIENRMADPDLNVNALSRLSGIGSKQIYRKTKLLTGMSPVEYIRSRRMKKAAMLLSENKYTVSEVMYKVGFSSPSYFAKCFQAEFGKSPKEYNG